MLLGIYSVYLIIFTVVAYFFLLPFILNYNSFYLFNWKVQFYILKNASDRMRKTPIKIHPLQEKIQAFQRSPVFQCKKELKIDQSKLKKIGRNRLIFKQPSLPVLNTIKNKENIQNFGQQHLAQVKKQANIKENAKNLSFSKTRQFNLQQALSRMIVSQKDLNHLNQSQKLKQLALKKQFFIRNRKMLPQRNCISAISPPLDRDKIDNLPQGIKDMRKVMRKKKSREVRQQQIKQLPISQQAKRMAEQARPSSAPNASKHPVRSASLQDFLNQWKIRCLD